MSPEVPQHFKRFNWIEIESAGQEFIRIDRLYLKLVQSFRREISNIFGDYMLCATLNGSSKNMPIIRIGQIQCLNQWDIACNQRIWKMLPHGFFLGANARFKLRLEFEQAVHPFIQDSLGPTRPKKPGVRKA